jgi:NitT/TauT family transport system substrate-binding protein
MSRRSLIKIASVAGAVALAAGLAACGSSGSSGSSGGSASGVSNVSGLPTVTLMVGGIDKQIYLPYQLAQDLGFYKKYGVNVQLSTEQQGGVGAEDAMVSGQVDMAGAWYVHAIDFQAKGKDVVAWCNCPARPESARCAARAPPSVRPRSGRATDIGSGTDELTLYLAARYHLTAKDINRVAIGAGPTFVASLQPLRHLHQPVRHRGQQARGLR